MRRDSTPASAYRYLRELGTVGLLVRLPRGYALGPRVIQLERQMSDGQYAQVQRNLQEIEDNVYDYLRLAQQDFLMREVNHRVQNSLQLISSFLALQARDCAAARPCASRRARSDPSA